MSTPPRDTGRKRPHRPGRSNGFETISSWAHRRLGVVLPPKKRSMVQVRLQRRIRATGIDDFETYVSHVLGPDGTAEERAELVHAITTHKTDFFREPHHFDTLRTFAEQGPFRRLKIPIRVWCAGCSTGEEAYTVAMVLAQVPDLQFTILATDVSQPVLEYARAGRYPRDRLDPVPPRMRDPLFRIEGTPPLEQAVLDDRLRSRVTFAPQNLMASEYRVRPRAHVVFCRNVLIYFDRPTQRAVLERLIQTMEPDGLLFLGHSETTQGFDLPIELVGITSYRLTGAPLEAARPGDRP